MKKQFNRMKQLANQTVGRAEKTEVLSDDLLQIERRLETVRLVAHSAHKRLVSCMQGNIGTEGEKRHKKLPLTALSQAMVDGGSQLGDESLIGKMMDICGEAENSLATELIQHEVHIERDVLEPLNQLAEVEIPNIQKQRKQLAKLVLDYDSAKNRYLQQSKSAIASGNNPALTAKAESLKEEMEEALNKVELCKDQLSADLYHFCSQEGEYAGYFLTLLEAQAEYHRRSLSTLESLLPSIKAQQESWTEKPAFGTHLDEHLKRSNREIALPIEACVMMLLETGMKEEGLFRIAAGASKLKKLKAALDCSTSQLEDFYSDPHAVAGALKSYLRELPEPLLTFQLYDDWSQAASVPDPDKRMQDLWVTCDKLPKSNKANFRYLVKFLAKLAEDCEVNKMTPSNIAIVLGPNLLWPKAEGNLAELAAATSVHVVTIIEPIIHHAEWFFPEEVDFNVSGMFVPAGNHSGALNDHDSGTLERRRPGSMDNESRKESIPRDHASTPPSQRNGGAGPHGTAPASTPSPGQLSVSTSSSFRSTSPHMVRRGTKKHAPAPPKPSNPPPPQPQTPTSSGTPPAPDSHARLISRHSQSSGSPHAGAIRRHSSGLTPLQAPNHPPPQPPPQIAPPPLLKGSDQALIAEPEADQSPPSSPSPPDSPSPPTEPCEINPYALPFTLNSGSLPRPKPVPKPRQRPSVPPPPQPPASDGANELFDSTPNIFTG